MKKINVLFIFLSFSLYSHEHRHEHEHNWRMDFKAFKSVKRYTNKKVNLPLFDQSFFKPNIEIDKEEFKEKLKIFSGAMESEPGVKLNSRCNLKQMKPAVDYLVREYEGLGFKAKGQSVGSRDQYLNLIAVKKGIAPKPKIIVISSHIDSVCNAGANDNGSGTIATLLIAKALRDIELNHTVYFVGFDNEESGMAGSKSFAKEMKNKYQDRFIANINLEMMATNRRGDRKFHVIDCDREDSNFITDVFAENIKKHNLDLKINEACTSRSDHSSFWRLGLPAVVVSENFFGGDSDRCYHRSCDVVDDRMDFGYMSEISKAVAYSVIELANSSKL